MGSENDENEDIEIISTHDEKAKVVGEILSNDSSRKILNLLNGGNELTINEISQKTGLSLSLVAHHLKRMQSAEVVRVSKVGRSVKGQKMNYYSATNQSFLIVPSKEPEDSLKSSLKKFSKFVAIGFAGVVSWITLSQKTHLNETIPIEQSPGAPDITVHDKIEEKWESAYQSESDSDTSIIPKDEFNTGKPIEPIPEPEPEPEPTSTPDMDEPSHSGIQDFSDYSDAGTEITGSVSLDRTVYPEPYGLSTDSVESAILSIIIPILVVVAGIILERVITRWYQNRKNKNSK